MKADAVNGRLEAVRRRRLGRLLGAGEQGEGEAEGEEDAGGAGEEGGAVAGVADDDSGERAGEEEGKVDEEIVGAERRAAIFNGNEANGFDTERREYEREAEADESGGGEGGGRNAREAEKQQAKDFDEKRDDRDGKAADAGNESGEKKAGENEGDAVDG